MLPMPRNKENSQNGLIAGGEPIDYDGGMPDEVRLTLRDLLKDPVYKKWFLKTPTLEYTAATSPPWYLYLLDNGKWKRGNAASYKGALKWAAAHLKEYDDIVIHSKRQAFRPIRLRKSYNPPRFYKVKGKKGKVEAMEVVEWDKFPHDHMWCPFCRRPTVWIPFKWHHGFTGASVNGVLPPDNRCHCCGLRAVEAMRINDGRNYGT